MNNQVWKYDTYSYLYYVCDDVYEKAVLEYLIQLDGCKYIFPSYSKLQLGLMSRPKAVNAVKSLEKKKFITIKRPSKKGVWRANTYKINHENIMVAIKKSIPIEEISKKAVREYSEKEKDAMTVRRAAIKPKLAHKAETISGNIVIDKKTGEFLNGEI